MIGAVIFVIIFLLATLISMAVPGGLPPADMITSSFIPSSEYDVYINAIVNGVIYGVIGWVVFSIVYMVVKRPKKAEVKLATCPKCKSIVPASKTWTVDGRPNKMGRRMRLEIGLFDCPQCSRTFRKILSKKEVV
jgi:hypothetical protein